MIPPNKAKPGMLVKVADCADYCVKGWSAIDNCNSWKELFPGTIGMLLKQTTGFLDDEWQLLIDNNVYYVSLMFLNIVDAPAELSKMNMENCEGK